MLDKIEDYTKTVLSGGVLGRSEIYELARLKINDLPYLFEAANSIRQQL